MQVIEHYNGRRYFSISISQEEEGREVLYFMKHHLNLSTKKIKSVKFCEYGIFLDKKRVTVRHKVMKGQQLLILLDDVLASCTCIIGCPMPIDILYEDSDFIFVNKASGYVCHPSQGHFADTYINAICAYLKGRGEKCSIHLLGRLDKDTSGIVGFAKNAVMQERMEKQRDEGLFFKRYLAIVEGKPEESGTINIRIKEDCEGKGWTHMISADENEGKEADTEYRVLGSNDEFSLVEVHIRTGRTHQIRCHMSQIGHPLLGDEIYGGRMNMEIKRAALHAYEVSFIHPLSDEKIRLSAPLPMDMKKIISDIEKIDKICDTI